MIKLYFILFFLFTQTQEKKIKTISTAKNQSDVTTGNDAVSQLDFHQLIQNRYSQYDPQQHPQDVSEFRVFQNQQLDYQLRQFSNQAVREDALLKHNMNWLVKNQAKSSLNDSELSSIRTEIDMFNEFKDSFIVDFPSEDSKRFSISDSDYWYVASKRGFLFQLGAILSIIFAFWIFTLRITYGKCGGYKTIVRKPTKNTRHHRIKLVAFSTFLTLTALGVALGLNIKYQITNYHIGESLIQQNKFQLNQVNPSTPSSLTNELIRLNEKNLDVKFGEDSFEKFRVARFTQYLKDEYKKSLQNATDFRKDFLLTQKTIHSLKIIFLIAMTSLIAGSFAYVYKKRKVLYSLGLTCLLFFLIVFTFNTLASGFNDWSVSVDMCNETIQLQEMSDHERGVNLKENMDQILTCLTPKAKQQLNTQILSVSLGVNTLMDIMNKFAIQQNYLKEVNENMFTTKNQVLNNQQHIRDILKANGMEEYIDSFMTLDEVQSNLLNLSDCQEQYLWASKVNGALCKDGIKLQFIALWALVIAIIGLFFLASGVYLSENVIRGIYNEEIQYVKTNKLRYDWN